MRCINYEIFVFFFIEEVTLKFVKEINFSFIIEKITKQKLNA